MKKVKLNNLYESPIPPSDTRILWADIDENTGDIRAIHRYKNGEWQPYLVSVEYLTNDEESDKEEPNDELPDNKDLPQQGGNIE